MAQPFRFLELPMELQVKVFTFYLDAPFDIVIERSVSEESGPEGRLVEKEIKDCRSTYAALWSSPQLYQQAKQAFHEGFSGRVDFVHFCPRFGECLGKLMVSVYKSLPKDKVKTITWGEMEQCQCREWPKCNLDYDEETTLYINGELRKPPGKIGINDQDHEDKTADEDNFGRYFDYDLDGLWEHAVCEQCSGDAHSQSERSESDEEIVSERNEHDEDVSDGEHHTEDESDESGLVTPLDEFDSDDEYNADGYDDQGQALCKCPLNLAETFPNLESVEFAIKYYRSEDIPPITHERQIPNLLDGCLDHIFTEYALEQIALFPPTYGQTIVTQTTGRPVTVRLTFFDYMHYVVGSWRFGEETPTGAQHWQYYVIMYEFENIDNLRVVSREITSVQPHNAN
ncbi:hypothetical protein PMZ80_002186 [Knufia obscura]|uniref:F-box domain-containing protein n=1 Tax=Knufia obscura TaxID=1635080 RepID=A0ABR0RWL7_9EURO|nr:hypothetical protein PMZ80_002186 [Knufia obscura]